MHLFLNAHYPFMQWRRAGYFVSAAFLVVALVGLAMHGGPKWSVDFTGGTLVEIGVGRPATIAEIRGSLEDLGLAASEIQQFGQSHVFLIRADRDRYGVDTGQRVVEAVQAKLFDTKVETRRIEDVGPKVGPELKMGAAKALFLGLLCILIYVGVRYELRFAAAAVVTLFFDVVVVVGILTLLNREFSLNIVAAILTIAGYSVNDTIIVFDRIRENLRLLRKDAFSNIVDKSINQTLSRTIITSGLTFSTVVCLYLFGGEVIRDFALALGMGIAIGTCASIFVASAIVVDWRAADQARSEKKRKVAA